MSRNRKHPNRPPHRRKSTASDRTKNTSGYRITGAWPQRPDRPAVKTTQDRRARDRIARDMAVQGAWVTVEEHRGYDAWRTLYEVDGPALVAEQQLAEQAAAERAERQAEAERRRRRLAAEATTHARALMAPPAIVRPENRQRARHITGAQR